MLDVRRWTLGGRTVALLTALVLASGIALAPVQAQSVGAQGPASTASVEADSAAAAAAPVSRADTTLIVKHNFNHRQQIITGSVIMACMAAMMVVMNNYNPQGLQN